MSVRRHIEGGTNRTLISAETYSRSPPGKEKRQKGIGSFRSSDAPDRPLHDRGRTHCRV